MIPPKYSPDCSLQYDKSFNRMGGQMHYVTADNRDFLLAPVRGIDEIGLI